MKRAFLFLILCLALSAWAQNQTVNGLKQGPWKVAYEGSTVIRYEGQFDRGIPVGTFTHYHPNGTKRAVMVFRGKTQACYAREFSQNGVLLAEGLYGAPGVKDSTWRIYSSQGQLLAIENYKGGKVEGEQTLYHDNGNILEQGNLVNGFRDGEWILYFDDGLKKRKCVFKEGKLEGEWIQFDENGNLEQKGMYRNDFRDGRWIEFENGQLVKITWYKDGEVFKEEKH